MKIIKNKVQLFFILAATIFVVLAMVGGIRSYSPVPLMDMWNGSLGFYVNISAGDLSGWWAQHNEHRILLARILYWLDFSLFSGLGWFLVTANYILVGITCVVFWRAWKETATNNTTWIGYFIIAWLFSWIQEENLWWGFQSQFILAQLLPFVALYLLHRFASVTPRQNRYFYSAILFGILSLGSMANGILALPLMSLYSIIVRIGWKRCVLLIALSAVGFWIYFQNFNSSSGHGSLGQALRENPVGLLHYVLFYIGGPFYYFFGKGAFGQFVAALAGLFMIGSSIVFAWRNISIAPKATLPLTLLFFILYIGGTALGTAGGRLIYGVEHAFRSSYMTPALMAWAALLLLYLPRFEALRDSLRARLFIPFLVLLIVMTPSQLKALKSQNDILFERIVASLALELGVKDQHQIGKIFPSADLALSIAQIPIEKNLSIFGHYLIKDARELVGSRITQSMQSAQQCSGNIDDIQSIEGESHYLRVRGWIFDQTRKNVPRSLNLINDNGVVEGVVIVGQTRPDVAKAIDSKASNSGFKGYIESNSQGKVITFYSQESGCKFTARVPAMLYSINQIKDESLVTVSTDKVQVGNTWIGSDFYHTKIPGFTVFGSFVNSDNDQGSIVLRLNRGDKFLYRSGPTGGRQIAKIMNHPELISILPVAPDWLLLEFSSDLLPEEFDIVLSDDGQGWGEWSSVALKTK